MAEPPVDDDIPEEEYSDDDEVEDDKFPTPPRWESKQPAATATAPPQPKQQPVEKAAPSEPASTEAPPAPAAAAVATAVVVAAVRPGVPLSLQSTPTPPASIAVAPNGHATESTSTAAEAVWDELTSVAASEPSSSSAAVVATSAMAASSEPSTAAAAAPVPVAPAPGSVDGDAAVVKPPPPPPPLSHLSALAVPRHHRNKKAVDDEAKRAQQEHEHQLLLKRLQAPVPERIDRLSQPRPMKVDPRHGLPPLEIELRQRAADAKYKETVKRRKEEFERVLEQEQRRLLERYNEYQREHGGHEIPAHLDAGAGRAEPRSSSTVDDDQGAPPVPPEDEQTVEGVDPAEIEAMFAVLMSLPPTVPQHSPPRQQHHLKPLVAGGGQVARKPFVSTGILDDGTVLTAGYVSPSPTNTQRRTFQPSTWKHGPQETETPTPTRHPAQRHAVPVVPQSKTPTPGLAGTDPKLFAAKGEGSGVGGGRLPQPRRISGATYGGLHCIDGAVSDFLGGGQVRRTIIPLKHRRVVAHS